MVPSSSEVMKFLSRLRPEHRAELEPILTIDAVTLLASIDDEALAARIEAVRAEIEMLFAVFGQTLDRLEAKIERDVANAFVSTVQPVEELRKLAVSVGLLLQ